MKNIINAFNAYSRSERNGIFILMVLVILLQVMYYTVPYWTRSSNVDTVAFQKMIAQIATRKSNTYNKQKESTSEDFTEISLFPFNPNQLPESDWLKLGLSRKQIAVIKKYEAKGGKFFKKEDVKKLYCISTTEYNTLAPYIRIPAKGFEPKETTRSVNKQIVLVEINTADSALLVKIPGIGPTFAARILKFRNRLGGFYTLTQLQEVYGIDSTRFEALKDFIKIDADRISKIDINTATIEEFKSQPYIGYKFGNAIINYRKQHGNYASVEELTKIILINEVAFNKMKPYLVIN